MERYRFRKKIALGTLAATAVCLPGIVSKTQGAEAPSVYSASSCSPNDEPQTTEQLLCKDRRIGKLGMIVIPNLPVKIRLFPMIKILFSKLQHKQPQHYEK